MAAQSIDTSQELSIDHTSTDNGRSPVSTQQQSVPSSSTFPKLTKIVKKGEYLYDSSPATSPEWSRLTFLLYLNDGFSGGQTTFFLPSPSQPQLDAYPVRPIAGCALVFPHGDAAGSLLHEGSPVDEGGCKYVIRTEVLYQSVRRGKVETDLLNGGL